LKHLKEIPHFDIMITNEEYEPTVAIELKYAAKTLNALRGVKAEMSTLVYHREVAML